MMKLWRMVRVSRLLDDRKDRSRCPWPEMRDQERVDAELSDASMLPWERPTAGMRSPNGFRSGAVVTAASRTRPARPDAGDCGVRPGA